MKLTIKYNNIEHNVECSDDVDLKSMFYIFKRLLMSCGYLFDDEKDIIIQSNKILNI